MSTHSIEIVRLIETEIANSFKLPSKEVVEKFNKLQERLLNLEVSDSEALEIKRRIAEAKISILFNRIDNENEMDQAWSDIEIIGYSTKEREASMLFYYSKYLIKNKKHKNIVINIIDRLVGLVEEFKTDQSQEKLAEHFAKVHANLISELKNSHV